MNDVATPRRSGILFPSTAEAELEFHLLTKLLFNTPVQYSIVADPQLSSLLI